MDLDADAGRLIDQLEALRHPSDLDLLIFFARHPRALLSSEHLATFLGYGAKKIAASLDLLLDAGFLSRTPNAKHAARMYVLAVMPPNDGWLTDLRELACTRPGRLALIRALGRRSTANEPHQREVRQKSGMVAPLPFLKGRTSGEEARRTPTPGTTGESNEESQQSGRGGES